MKTNITPNRPRLSHDEWDAILALEAVHSVLVSKNVFPVLEQRIKKVKYGKRDAALAASAIGRLMRDMYDDVPYEQLKSLSNNLKMSQLHVGVKALNKHSNDEYGMVLSWNQLNILGSAALEKCATCMLDPQEQKKCPLAKILDELPGFKHQYGNGCGWFVL